jgi:branched-chain amino acid transport system permease protein
MRSEGSWKVLVILLLIVATISPFFASSYLLTVVITAFHFTYLAQCWNIIFGYGGQLALGNGVFYGIAGYFSTIVYMRLDITPYLGGVIGAIVGAAFAIPVGAIVFRTKLKGLYLALVTFASMEIFKALFNNWKLVGSSVGILLPLKSSPGNFLFLSRMPYYYIALVMVILMAIVTSLMENSKIGYRAVAVRENEEAAEASGINSFKTKMYLFVISAFFTGLAGTFYSQFMLYIVPEIMFGFPNVVLLPMLGVIIGGRGTVFGPIIGTMVFSFISELLRRVPFLHGPQVSAVTMVFYGIILSFVSLRYYGGLMSLLDKRKTDSISSEKFRKGYLGEDVAGS